MAENRRPARVAFALILTSLVASPALPVEGRSPATASSIYDRRYLPAYAGVDLAGRLEQAVRDSGLGYIRLLGVGRSISSRRREVVQEPCVLVPNMALADGSPLADFDQHLLRWCLSCRLPVALRHTSVDGSIVNEIVDFKPDAEPPEPIDSQLYKGFGPAVRGFFELVWQHQGEPGRLLLVRYADRPTNRTQSAELHRQGDLRSLPHSILHPGEYFPPTN